MGSPVIFRGNNAYFINNGGLQFKSGTTIEPYAGNPNGALTRAKGSLVLDILNGDVYINTDGATGWKKYLDGLTIARTDELTGDGTTDNPLGLSGLIQASTLRFRTGDSDATTVLLADSGSFTVTRAPDINTPPLNSIMTGRNIIFNSVDEYGTPLVSFYGTITSGAWQGTTQEVYSFGRQGMTCPYRIDFVARHIDSGYGVDAGYISTYEYKPVRVLLGPNFPIDTSDLTIEEGCVYGLSGVTALTPAYRYSATPENTINHRWYSNTTNAVHEVVNTQENAPYIVCKHETDAGRKVTIYNDKVEIKNLSITETELTNTALGHKYLRLYSTGGVGIANIPQVTFPRAIFGPSTSVFYSLGYFNDEHIPFDTAYIGNNYNVGAATHVFRGVYTDIPAPDSKPTMLVSGNYTSSQHGANLVIATGSDNTPFESVGVYCDYSQFNEGCYYFCKGIKYVGSSVFELVHGNNTIMYTYQNSMFTTSKYKSAHSRVSTEIDARVTSFLFG